MPDHKSQHYVPKCHLKPFSSDGSGKAINLLNLERRALIANASIRKQCAKNYFYGSDLLIERGLQNIEGRYASIIKKLATKIVDYNDLQFLRDFCYLQYLRTDFAAKRQALAMQDMRQLIFEGTPEESRPRSLSEKDLVQDAISSFIDTVEVIADLKVCLIINETWRHFVTSDDPAVSLNRFYSQRLGPRWKSFGIENAGVILILPLSPKLLICSYDGDIYTCPDKNGHIVSIDKESDARALNTLQYLKASKNLYFSDWDQAESIQADFSAIAAKRPEKWHNIHFAVKDEKGSTAESERYRVVHTREERTSATEAFVHLQSVMLEPEVWLSKIKFRQKLKYIDTKTGAGYRRHSRR
jgi:hypothetical protein